MSEWMAKLMDTFELISEMEGSEGVFEYANHIGLPFAYCRLCETETPHVSGDCCCCGVSQ